ncbi:IS110 family transposase [Hungatella effluvii]|uniref:IS110 family transposase n=1 Tax=Hungatella effluvii TaxID=1096246 RepID=UPI0025414FF0|nr:IS110 family transposase [Hungatella effluvii]
MSRMLRRLPSPYFAVGFDPHRSEDAVRNITNEVTAMLFVGIDIAKRNHEAAVIDQQGHVVRKPMRFANSQLGYNKFMDMVRNQGEPVVFGMEATGHYWLTLYTHLRNDGCTVHVINPIQSDALRGMYIRKTKNDAVDAVIIADVIRFGRYCETSVEPGDLQAMRELCRQRFYIIDMASDLKRKVIALLDQVFPEYEKLFSDTFGASSMELLARYTTPEEMLSVDSGKLAELLEQASRGRLGEAKAQEIQAAARNSFGLVMASNSFALIIRQYIEQIRSLEASVDAFDAEIARLLAGFDTQLTTITGIGPTLAAVILSEIGGDISRFPSAVKLAAFAGVDPTVKQSGDFNGTRMKMSKRGSPYLRRAIWLASTVAAFKDPAIHALYERKRAEGKDHMTTIGHVCRKMVSIIFAVLRDNSPYVPAQLPD